jgi:hypothetical protein
MPEEELAELVSLNPLPCPLKAKGAPNSSTVKDYGNGQGQIRDFDDEGQAKTDYDFGHDHDGSGDPHAHDWDWNRIPPRGAPRPLWSGE